MTTFHLTVVTPDGCAFEGQAERIVCRAIDGDIAILAKHGDYCTALGMGEAHIVDADGQRRRAACMGGLLSVLDGDVRLVATTWEWAEDIDQARAEASKKRAEEILAANLNDREYELAQRASSARWCAPLSVKTCMQKGTRSRMAVGAFSARDDFKCAPQVAASPSQSRYARQLSQRESPWHGGTVSG